MIYKEGQSSYGQCWIEGDRITFWEYTMNGSSRHGPYSTLSEAYNQLQKTNQRVFVFSLKLPC